MRLRFLSMVLLLALLLAGCSESPPRPGMQPLKLPDGTRVWMELKLTPEEQAKGMMFRNSLPQDEGMLFVHATEDRRGYWMFQCEIPLDIIWLDRNRRIVEISANTPPCREVAEKCPNYGGNRPSMFVVELAAGMAEKHGLRLGDTLQF